MQREESKKKRGGGIRMAEGAIFTQIVINIKRKHNLDKHGPFCTNYLIKISLNKTFCFIITILVYLTPFFTPGGIKSFKFIK